jgi:hypothetical protein
VRFWKSCGVTHLTLGTYSGRGHLRRIEGRTLGDHLAAIKRYWNAVADCCKCDRPGRAAEILRQHRRVDFS